MQKYFKFYLTNISIAEISSSSFISSFYRGLGWELSEPIITHFLQLTAAENTVFALTHGINLE